MGNRLHGHLLIAVLALGCAARVDGLAPDDGAPTAMVSVTLTPTSDERPNPDRGFYGWAGSDLVTSFDAASAQRAFDAGRRLVLAKVLLANFRTSDLSASFLATLSSRLATLRSMGLKVTLLFLYDDGAGGNDTTAAWIQRHLEQLRPVLAANADVITYMRAGFIGAWGEWHSSKSGNSCGYNSGTTSCSTAAVNRAIVRDALFANVPATTQIAFRNPGDLIEWYPSASESRAGLHNDCFLAGVSDTGTYATNSQRAYAQALTDNAAFGAETCNGETPLRMSCSDILTEGAAYHLAWLNEEYYAGFISAWQSGGCLAEVTRTMGYRIELDRVTHASQVARGGSLAVEIELRNVGWSRMFDERQLEVTLVDATGSHMVGAAGNLRTLAASATTTSRIVVDVAIPASAATGEYHVLLGAPDVFAATHDDPRFAVQFANADTAAQRWDPATATFDVGTTVLVE